MSELAERSGRISLYL